MNSQRILDQVNYKSRVQMIVTLEFHKNKQIFQYDELDDEAISMPFYRPLVQQHKKHDNYKKKLKIK